MLRERYIGRFYDEVQEELKNAGVIYQRINPGMIYTQEYIANRYNFYVNSEGIITEVTNC